MTRKDTRKVAPGKILVVKPSSLGDVVHSLPFLNALKTCYPGAQIHWVIARGLEGLLEGHPMIDNLIMINKDTWKKISSSGKTIREVRDLFRTIREHKYDIVIDLQGLLRSGLITMASRSPLRVGFARSREGSGIFYNRKVRTEKEMHAVDRYLAVAEDLGCDEGKEILFPFPLTGNESSHIADIKERAGKYIVMVPGARWETKKWPVEYFGKAAASLPLNSIVVGGPSDAALAEEIVALSGGKAVSLAGRTDLRDLISVMRDASIVISNDSGPMHIAAGCGVPVVSIFGPTSPVRTGPYGEGHVVIQSGADCSPCFRKKCRDPKCMKEITVERVCGTIRNNFTF